MVRYLKIIYVPWDKQYRNCSKYCNILMCLFLNIQLFFRLYVEHYDMSHCLNIASNMSYVTWALRQWAWSIGNCNNLQNLRVEQKNCKCIILWRPKKKLVVRTRPWIGKKVSQLWNNVRSHSQSFFTSWLVMRYWFLTLYVVFSSLGLISFNEITNKHTNDKRKDTKRVHYERYNF